MTERERKMDALIVEMADGLCKLLNPKHPTSSENFADGIANATEVFREASAKQDDEDRSSARRAIAKKDCAETHVVIPCEMKGEGCKRCPDTACNLREMASEVKALPEQEKITVSMTGRESKAGRATVEAKRHCSFHGDHEKTELCPMCVEIANGVRQN